MRRHVESVLPHVESLIINEKSRQADLEVSLSYKQSCHNKKHSQASRNAMTIRDYTH